MQVKSTKDLKSINPQHYFPLTTTANIKFNPQTQHFTTVKSSQNIKFPSSSELINDKNSSSNPNISINNHLKRKQTSVSPSHKNLQSHPSLAKIVATNCDLRTHPTESNKHISETKINYNISKPHHHHHHHHPLTCVRQLNKEIKTQQSSTSIEINTSLTAPDSKRNTLFEKTPSTETTATAINNTDSYHDINPYLDFSKKQNSTAKIIDFPKTQQQQQQLPYQQSKQQKQQIQSHDRVPILKLPTFLQVKEPGTPNSLKQHFSTSRPSLQNLPEDLSDHNNNNLNNTNNNNIIIIQQNKQVNSSNKNTPIPEKRPTTYIKQTRQYQIPQRQTIPSQEQYDQQQQQQQQNEIQKNIIYNETPKQKYDQQVFNYTTPSVNNTPQFHTDIASKKQSPVIHNHTNPEESKLEKQVKKWNYEKTNTIENRLKQSTFYTLTPSDQQIPYHHNQYHCEKCKQDLVICDKKEQWVCQLCKEENKGIRRSSKLVCQNHPNIKYCSPCINILSQAQQLKIQLYQELEKNPKAAQIKSKFYCTEMGCNSKFENFSHENAPFMCQNCSQLVNGDSIFRLKCPNHNKNICGKCCNNLITNIDL